MEFLLHELHSSSGIIYQSLFLIHETRVSAKLQNITFNDLDFWTLTPYLKQGV